VALRLIFDNPRDPDFELELWPPADPTKRERATVTDAIAISRRWLSGVEAILRQPEPRPAVAAPREEPDEDDEEPPWDEDEEAR
jgi:hypothetical protein